MNYADPKNDGKFFWLIMPENSPTRDVVVEFQHCDLLGDEYLAYRRRYTPLQVLQIVNRGGQLVPIPHPSEVMA